MRRSEGEGEMKIKHTVLVDRDTLIGRCIEGKLWVCRDWRKPKKAKWERLSGVEKDATMEIITEGNNQSF